MGTPKAWLDWHGTTLLWRVCGLVGDGVGGPVIVVRAPGQELPGVPAGVRVVDDAREGHGPLQGLLAGLEAAEDEVAFAASVDMPFLHPRFIRAVCDALGDADAAVPRTDGHREPFAAAYRTSLAPLLAELLAQGETSPGALLARCRTRWLDDGLPHPESLRNLNTRDQYEAALAETGPGPADPGS
jgi:molybdenum cofactor guanylyltransferase